MSSIESSVKLSKPFSSDTNEVKEDLHKEADLYLQKLEEQWEGIKSEAKDHGKNALVIGGVLTGTYLLMNAILPEPKEEVQLQKSLAEPKELKKVAPVQKSGFAVSNALQSLAWTFVVGWARNALKNYIADDIKPNENIES
jgi:hypothetical protein